MAFVKPVHVSKKSIIQCLAQLLLRLECKYRPHDDGYVRTEEDPRDKRFSGVFLNAEGRRGLEEVLQGFCKEGYRERDVSIVGGIL